MFKTKYSYTYIKAAFGKENYTLLSTEYINSKTKLFYMCDQGHNNSITWNNFQQGQRCPNCVNNNLKYTYDFIKIAFEKEHYKLLSTEYTNAHTRLNYICPEGHEGAIVWNSFREGRRCFACGVLKRSGEESGRWKGGVASNNLPLYGTFATQLEKYQPVYKIECAGLDLLGVHCMYCNQTFIPKNKDLQRRLHTIKYKTSSENNLYCSENCKKACPTFGKRRYPDGFKLDTSREVQPELRKIVLARDNYKCQICEATLEETELHCHHIEAISQNPIESADIDNCITLCKKHHKQVHALPDCGYHELRCS